jgi:hypothetical protein
MIRSAIALAVLSLTACDAKDHGEPLLRKDPAAGIMLMDPCEAEKLAHLRGKPLSMSDPDIPPPLPDRVRYIYPRDRLIPRDRVILPKGDKNQFRLNIETDDSGIITRIYCG